MKKTRNRYRTPFWEKVDVQGPDDCWNWKFYVNPHNGYGQSKDFGEFHRAHRFAYQLFYGPLQPFNVVMHICDNKVCCNPRHLRSGSQAENCLDAHSKDRHSRGSRHGMAKLTENQVREIFTDSRSSGQVAKSFGISRKVVKLIRDKKSWKHIHPIL